jgi:hypothetical protein
VSLGFEVFTAVTVKNIVFWDVAPCWFIINDVSEKPVAYIISVEEMPRARKSIRPLLTQVCNKPTRRYIPENDIPHCFCPILTKIGM